MTSDDDNRFVEIAWRLDRLRWVPREVLGDIVMRDGSCVWAYTDGDPPQLTGHTLTDRGLALWLCGTCPVQDECLELELRLSGEHTTGVWGALSEEDRRAVYSHWRARGERAEPLDTDEDEGGRS